MRIFKVFILILFLALNTAAYAADIEGVNVFIKAGKGFKWENITSGDTVQSHKWEGGNGVIILEGTFDEMDVEVFFDPLASTGGNEVSIDADEKPDGFQFTSAGGLAFRLPPGMMDLNFTSGAGLYTDVDAYVLPTD